VSAAAVLNKATSLGVNLWADADGKLRWRCAGGLPADMREDLVAHKAELVNLLSLPCTTHDETDETHNELLLSERLSAELALEVEEIERREFNWHFPPILARCVGHSLAGPSCMPPAEGASAWWEGARRQVLRLIEAVKKDPTRYAAWRPPEP
jgi:hypothetical protein